MVQGKVKFRLGLRGSRDVQRESSLRVFIGMRLIKLIKESIEPSSPKGSLARRSASEG